MSQEAQKIIQKLESGFFGFWVRNYRISFLTIVFILILGGVSLSLIPKESSPDIDFGIISINTVYTGVSPEDIDSLITTKIEDELDSVDGIQEITSSSRLGFSSMSVTLEPGVDVAKTLQDIKDATDKAQIPSGSEDPSVTEISTDNEVVFAVYLYGPEATYSHEYLTYRASQIQKRLEGNSGISDVNISTGDSYDLYVLVERGKLQALDIDISTIASSLTSANIVQPLGSISLDDTSYDFRVDGEFSSVSDIYNHTISLGNGRQISLLDVARIERNWSNEGQYQLGTFENPANRYVELIVNKSAGVSIFAASEYARSELEEFLASSDGQGLAISYGQDLADTIVDDYRDLGRNALITFILVFFSVWLFVGVKEGVIASLSILLSFFCTFFILNSLGLSLNFLTNFSLVLTFGIAIDTTIVIIEAAAEKMKIGYKSRNAVLLAVRDYKLPLIAGTATTLFAFLPMFNLPGVTGKFLAYIPITIFATLLAALFLSLTINSALFYRFSKTKSTYIGRGEADKHLPEDEILLMQDREGRTQIPQQKGNMRDRFLASLESKYEYLLERVISTTRSRRLWIFLPIILLVFTFVFVSPRLGFNLFPSGDTQYLFVDIESPIGLDESSLYPALTKVHDVLSDIPEILVYTAAIQGNTMTVSVELQKKSYREDQGLRLSDEVDKQMSEEFLSLTSLGYKISTRELAGGPPTGKPVGIKLVASDTSLLSGLIATSNDFESYLRSLPGTKAITNSAQQSPGQIVFRADDEKLVNFGISPSTVYGQLSRLLVGQRAGSLTSEGEDRDIYVQFEDFYDSIITQDVLSYQITTSVGNLALGDVLDYEVKNAITSVGREDGDLLISVQADVDSGIIPQQLQAQFVRFADSYDFPSGISYQTAGENAENQDLLIATATSFLIAILLIFLVLVLIFNSYSQPLVILYSVVLALLGVNLGLWITGNPYSMPFGIGFIALTGIVVNDAIILLDRANQNRKLGMQGFQVVIEAGKSRLQPILLTTVTTVFGVLPLALQDEFWAGLSYTIVFGLISGSAMTLFVIPALYYQVYLRKER